MAETLSCAGQISKRFDNQEVAYVMDKQLRFKMFGRGLSQSRVSDGFHNVKAGYNVSLLNQLTVAWRCDLPEWVNHN